MLGGSHICRAREGSTARISTIATYPGIGAARHDVDDNAPGTLAGGIFSGFPCNTVNEYSLSVDCFEPCNSGGVCDCRWDLDDSGDVGVVDFLALLAAWGPNPGHPADFNCDGNVDVLDFLTLLANWGPCP